MEKRCSLGLFSFAIFLAFDPAFAPKAFGVTENGNPLIRKSLGDPLLTVNSTAFSARQLPVSSRPARRYPWKTKIVTTIFWIGEQPSGNNPVPNHTSSWDKQWTRNYGGFDDPNPGHRSNYIPVKFTPRQNPFYCAIRKGNRTVYAQWEDAGPFRTDHWQYVFGNERPKPNLNKGAGLDVSPAVRDYLGINETDVTDWKFVDFSEVPHGPWSTLGDNNTFVINDRKKGKALAETWFSHSTSRTVK